MFMSGMPVNDGVAHLATDSNVELLLQLIVVTLSSLFIWPRYSNNSKVFISKAVGMMNYQGVGHVGLGYLIGSFTFT